MFAANEPLQIEEIELAGPGSGEVRLQVEGQGVIFGVAPDGPQPETLG